jgi:hypothetical protein
MMKFKRFINGDDITVVENTNGMQIVMINHDLMVPKPWLKIFPKPWLRPISLRQKIKRTLHCLLVGYGIAYLDYLIDDMDVLTSALETQLRAEGKEVSA